MYNNQHILLLTDIPTECDDARKTVFSIENATDISSPKFPKHYPIDANCTWHIVANDDTRIELSIEGYEIEK